MDTFFKTIKEKEGIVFKPLMDQKTGELWDEITFFYFPKTHKLFGGKLKRSHFSTKQCNSKDFVKKVQSIPGVFLAANVSNLTMAQNLAIQWLSKYPVYHNMSLIAVVENGALNIVRSNTFGPNSYV